MTILRCVGLKRRLQEELLHYCCYSAFFVFFVNNVNQVTTYNWLATGKRTQEVPRLQGKREGMSLCVCVCV